MSSVDSGSATEVALRMLRDGSSPADIKKHLKAAGFKTKAVLLAIRDARRLRNNAPAASDAAAGKSGATEAAATSPLSSIDSATARNILQICGDSTASTGEAYTVDDVKTVLACFALERASGASSKSPGNYANDAVNVLMGGIHMPTWRNKLRKATAPSSDPGASSSRGAQQNDAHVSSGSKHTHNVDEVCAIVLGGAAVSSSGEPYTRSDVEDVCIAYQGTTDELVGQMLGGLYMPIWRERAQPLRHLRDIRATYSGRTFECGVCLSTYPIEETFSFDCLDAHRACIECSTSHVRASIQERNLPRCIGCQYRVSTVELKQIERQNEALLLAGRGGESKNSSDRESPIVVIHDGKAVRISDAKENIEMQVYMRNQDDVRACPAPNCPGYVACRTPGQVERCICPVCGFCYCGVCLQMYHYGTATCAEVRSLRRKYEHWKTEGRLPYLRLLAAQRTEMAAQLREYENKKAAHERDAKVAEQMRKAEIADEKYKEEHCFHCPKCNRLMEWLEKCNLMVCGRDYHGGNQQDGCGHRFDKRRARKYKSTGVRQREVAALNVSAPDFQELKHEIVEGTSIKCDDCQEDIVGPRFECIHCPAYNLCAGCESKLLSTGAGDGGEAGSAPGMSLAEGKRGRGGGQVPNHSAGNYRAHVFRLHINE
eukprot:g1900.t1